MEKILMIDDDKGLGELLGRYFHQFQLELTQALRPSEGLELLKTRHYSAIILDVMLPEMDGFETFKDIRKLTDIPVIMLTARGELSDKIVGFELGIDDYLSKPFEARELVARIKNMIRKRTQTKKTSILIAGNLRLNLDSQFVELDNNRIELSGYEFHLLKLFMENPGKVLSRDQILDKMRGIEWEIYNRSVDVAISRIRNKLGDSAKSATYLKTIWGEGYCFIHKVEEAF